MTEQVSFNLRGRNPDVRFLDPFIKSGVFLRETTSRLTEGLALHMPNQKERVNHIVARQGFGICITRLTSLLALRSLYDSKRANGPHSVTKRFGERYGAGFSVPNLKNFRQFYQACPGSCLSIGYPSGTKSLQGFAPQLTRSHYRALMRVDNLAERDFYEREAIECGWSKAQLERQIHTFYFDRIVAHDGQSVLLPNGRERLPGDPKVLKSPMVLEFLGLPSWHCLHESRLEQAVINNLQTFLLELGKGFSFVARQKHIGFDEQDFFASKYMLSLPTEEQLRLEIERERCLIESAMEEDRANE